MSAHWLDSMHRTAVDAFLDHTVDMDDLLGTYTRSAVAFHRKGRLSSLELGHLTRALVALNQARWDERYAVIQARGQAWYGA